MSLNDFMEAVIPCLFVFIIFSLFFGFIVLMRYLHYKETMALAEKGLVRPKRTPKNGQNTLRWGIIITALGLALCIGIYPLGFELRYQIPLLLWSLDVNWAFADFFWPGLDTNLLLDPAR